MPQMQRINRHKFLKSIAGFVSGTITFPYFVSSSALGKDGSVAPSDRITIGCIDLGGQGTRNMQDLIKFPDVQIIALCDVNEGSDDYDMLYQSRGSSSAGLEPARRRAVKCYPEQNRKLSYESFSVYSLSKRRFFNDTKK